jgi:hypothetical protein
MLVPPRCNQKGFLSIAQMYGGMAHHIIFIMVAPTKTYRQTALIIICPQQATGHGFL